MGGDPHFGGMAELAREVLREYAPAAAEGNAAALQIVHSAALLSKTVEVLAKLQPQSVTAGDVAIVRTEASEVSVLLGLLKREADGLEVLRAKIEAAQRGIDRGRALRDAHAERAFERKAMG
jgi:hypothetical protein